jgi:hypothetical protein
MREGRIVATFDRAEMTAERLVGAATGNVEREPAAQAEAAAEEEEGGDRPPARRRQAASARVASWAGSAACCSRATPCWR